MLKLSAGWSLSFLNVKDIGGIWIKQLGRNQNEWK